MEATTPTQTRTGVITGHEGAPIDLDKAAEFTAYHRHRHTKGATISQFFGHVILNKILEQPGCLGIRIYYANRQKLSSSQKFLVAIGNFFIKTLANAEGDMRFVISGVTEDGEDMLPGEMKGKAAISTVKAIAEKKATPEKTYSLKAPVTVGDDSHPCPGSSGCPQNALTGGY
ncbi:hypothetical protein [Mucilaginibacter aquaedulcis]|uniref:hypothetical protein n=1 Tax=Mucilaginibacter aquaedulcis TaxID=1187081 RepID=UPI0025B42E1D|nr:hypothetical protein [Mucilaginibacter aquaedulcis]MDN3550984.1 hypothetical protein [Mucilaginibacter aquaedulcis]